MQDFKQTNKLKLVLTDVLLEKLWICFGYFLCLQLANMYCLDFAFSLVLYPWDYNNAIRPIVDEFLRNGKKVK